MGSHRRLAAACVSRDHAQFLLGRYFVAVAVDRLNEEFDGDQLDLDVWSPYYLPHWSSREQSAATYTVGGGELRLSIPPRQAVWCPDLHDEPLRVSCIQSGNWSGPAGSRTRTAAVQGWIAGARGATGSLGIHAALYGRVEIEMRGLITPGSMFALWLSGIEDQPHRSGEICVAEIFGAGVADGVAQIGMGVHEFRDPSLREEFAAEPLRLDPAEFHTYAVDWRPGSLSFSVDGSRVRSLDQSPDYPMQLMIGVFDFPAKATEVDVAAVPEMVIRAVRGSPLTPPDEAMSHFRSLSVVKLLWMFDHRFSNASHPSRYCALNSGRAKKELHEHHPRPATRSSRDRCRQRGRHRCIRCSVRS